MEDAFSWPTTFAVLFYPFALLVIGTFKYSSIGFKSVWEALRGRHSDPKLVRDVFRTLGFSANGCGLCLGISAWRNYLNARWFFIVGCVVLYGVTFVSSRRVVRIDSTLKSH